MAIEEIAPFLVELLWCERVEWGRAGPGGTATGRMGGPVLAFSLAHVIQSAPFQPLMVLASMSCVIVHTNSGGVSVILKGR